MVTTATEVPPATDYDEIVRVVQLYVDGCNDNDINKFKEAFHEDAWIFFTFPDGTLFKDWIANCLEGWAAPPSWNIRGRIISVTQAGDIATVLLGFDTTDEWAPGWVDRHSLLRTDGVWKITNKTATHSSRAAWASAPLQDDAGVDVMPPILPAMRWQAYQTSALATSRYVPRTPSSHRFSSRLIPACA